MDTIFRVKMNKINKIKIKKFRKLCKLKSNTVIHFFLSSFIPFAFLVNLPKWILNLPKVLNVLHISGRLIVDKMEY